MRPSLDLRPVTKPAQLSHSDPTPDLIERVAAEHGLAKDHARKIIDTALAAITAAAASGEEVALAGFGRFKVADRPERQGRNPATGEPITIAASRKLSFTPTKALRDALNQTPTKNAAKAA